MYATTKVAEMFILTHMQRKETRGEAQCMWAGSIWYTTTPIRMPRISVLMPSRPLPPQPIRAQAPAVQLSTNHSSPVGPPPADLLREQHPHEVAGPLHQPQQEQVQEGVAAHVGHVDHDLVQKYLIIS